MDNKIIVADELLDEDLKQILGNRYQDATHLFTPEAQERRRNNRLVFTARIAAFMLVLVFFMYWAHLEGLMTVGIMVIGIAGCVSVIGYNAGVCISHLKGWRD